MSWLTANPYVLLEIIDFLDVPIVLSLRLLCKSVDQLIKNYSTSIAGGVIRTSFHTLPTERLSYLRLKCHRDIVRLHVARELAIKAVASAQLDLFHPGHYCPGISYDDPLGNEMRDRVTKGFLMLYRLSDLHINLCSDSFGLRRRDCIKILFTGRPTRSTIEKNASRVQQWEQYRNSLGQSDLMNLELMVKTVLGKFIYHGRTAPFAIPLWTDVITYYESGALVCLINHILNRGPIFLQRFWDEEEERTGDMSEYMRWMIGYPREIDTYRKSTWRLLPAPVYPLSALNMISPVHRTPQNNALFLYVSAFYWRRSSLTEMTSEEQTTLEEFDVADWLEPVPFLGDEWWWEHAKRRQPASFKPFFYRYETS